MSSRKDRKDRKDKQIQAKRIIDLYEPINSKFESEIIIDDTNCESESIVSSITTCSNETNTTCETTNTENSYNKISYIKYLIKKRNESKKTKPIIQMKDLEYYNGSFVSEFNKYSPFISMLIKKRICGNDNGSSCHIAAFVNDLYTENKHLSWALGKIAIGENSEKMRFGNERLSTHAEMNALKKLDNLIRVKKCKKQKMDLVVIRINKSGNLCESAPCHHCTKELENTKVVTINKLYFSRSDGTISCIKFSEWIKNEQFHITKGWKRIKHNTNCMYSCAK